MATVLLRSTDDTLSHTEIDANFNNLNNDKEESIPPAAGGSANVIILTYEPTETALVTDTVYVTRATASNTGAVTLQIDQTAALAVQTVGGNALVGGEIQENNIHWFLYNGTNFRLLNPYLPPRRDVTNHQCARGYYFASDLATSFTDSVTTGHTTWQSTNGWAALTALSVLYHNVKSVFIRVQCELDPSSDEVEMYFHTQPTGNTWTAADSTMQFTVDTSDVTNTSQEWWTQIEVAVDPATGEFEYQVALDDATTIDCNIEFELVGFSVGDDA
jgi:hypothetical protein